jgi:hypothetical protein
MVCYYYFVRKLAGEMRTAKKRERKSQDFLREKISRFTEIYNKK